MQKANTKSKYNHGHKAKTRQNKEEVMKRIFCTMMALVMLITLFPVTTAYAAALTGSGTATDPYLIATQEDLMAIGDTDSAGKFYKLSNDITVDSSFKTIYSFSGYFNGNGKTIFGISVVATVEKSGQGYASKNEGSLFYKIEKGAAVYNLTLESPKFTHSFGAGVSGRQGIYGGILSRYNEGLIDSVTINNADVDLSNNLENSTDQIQPNGFGMLCYENAGKVTNCTVSGNMSIPSGLYNTGGLVGINGRLAYSSDQPETAMYGTIAACRAKVNMSIDYDGYWDHLSFVAPGVGYNLYGRLYNVWTEGTITNNLVFIDKDSWCGLVFGFTTSDSEVKSCYYDYTFKGSRSQADTINNPKGTCASNMSLSDLASVYGQAFSQSDFNSACKPEIT